jgi:UDP-2,3-diacylglucosamine pyrophosphatase LpxH
MTDYDIDTGPDPETLMLIGDTHHDLDFTLAVIETGRAKGVDTFLQVGDFGYWPNRYPDFHGNVDDALGYGERFFFLDGNHDHHGDLVPGMTYGKLRHLPRGFRWQWWGRTWMALGGGATLNRHHYTPGYDWFPSETLSTAEALYAMRPGGVDIIVSHDAPNRIPSLDQHLNPARYPAADVAVSDAHRGLVGDILDATGAETLIHGHYHRGYQDRRIGIRHAQIIGLGGNETSVEQATVVWERKGLPAQPPLLSGAR